MISSSLRWTLGDVTDAVDFKVVGDVGTEVEVNKSVKLPDSDVVMLVVVVDGVIVLVARSTLNLIADSINRMFEAGEQKSPADPRFSVYDHSGLLIARSNINHVGGRRRDPTRPDPDSPLHEQQLAQSESLIQSSSQLHPQVPKKPAITQRTQPVMHKPHEVPIERSGSTLFGPID